MKNKVLTVDDDDSIRSIMTEALRLWEYEPLNAASVGEAREIFRTEEIAAVLLDIDLPDGSGLDLLREIKAQYPETIVIMITGNVDVKNTISSLRGGAHDFIAKPLRLEELRITLQNALETGQLRQNLKTVRNEQLKEFNFWQIIGQSPAIVRAKALAKKVSESDVETILLQGETGTGKDLFARAIHYGSKKGNAPFVAINCAAIPATLIESELFGYEKGAFTDAKARKEGLFEQARGGTIFLDEIGELELNLQVKLLRVLEENTFRRVGGLKDLPLNARIIAASNRDLKAAAEEEKFRLDLYYRLSVIRIDIPPLRMRGDDCLLLARYYIDKTNEKRRIGKLKGLSKEVEGIFKNYNWAGNVRELRNVIERASILEEGEYITTEFLPADMTENRISKNQKGNFTLPPEGIALEEVESLLAKQAFERTGGNLTKAARLLHISRDQLRYRLKKTGEDYREII